MTTTVPVLPDVHLRSRTLFRNSYMLGLCAAIDQATDRVNLKFLASSSSVAPSLYSDNVRRLVAVGLLVEEPLADDDWREKWYRPQPSLLWAAARELFS